MPQVLALGGGTGNTGRCPPTAPSPPPTRSRHAGQKYGCFSVSLQHCHSAQLESAMWGGNVPCSVASPAFVGAVAGPCWEVAVRGEKMPCSAASLSRAAVTADTFRAGCV